ncbi:MAG TPA: TonB-dependent receptor [Sphingomicrobium sp.]|jgi:iron complex outermembrane receptor protein|nr:TonB-dependent receptor [Sphingomicrobium sp.]
MPYRTASAIRATLLAGAAMIAATPLPALAAQAQPAPAEQPADQSAAQPAAEVDASADASATRDIVVTARRTEETLQRVPASISAFNERALDRIQATDPTGLQGAVPNLNIVQGRGSSNAMNIYIRGIGQPDALQTFDPAVGVYVDDVYLSRIRGTQLDLLDLERVEVLRGPQGTLYGKNTIGGALKFVTRKPGQQFRATGSVAIGSYDQFEVKGSASGPVSETLAAGFAVMRAKRDGFVEDAADDREYNDKDTVAGRAALAFTPSSTVRIDLSADYAHDDAKLNVGQPLNSLTYLIGGGVLLALPSNPDPDDYDFKGRTTPGLPNSTKMTHWGLAGTAAIDLTEALTLKSITAFRKLKTDDYVDIDATEKEVGDVFVGVDQKQLSQELQLALTAGRLTGVAGLYYLKENIDSHQEAYADDLIGPLLGNPTFLRTIDDKLETTSYAAYANASFEITPELRLSAGARYTHEKKDYFRTTSTFSSSPLLTSVTPFLFDVKDHWNDFSPMASLDYQFSPNVMVYARFAKGFKSGGFNGRANSVAERTQYEPEKVTSYEIGLRSTIADQLRFNLTGFYNDYKDFQARVAGTGLDPVTDLPSPVLSVINAGKLQIKGVELETAWTPLKEVLVDAQIGYLDADYKEFDDGRFPNGSRAFQTPAFAPKWTMRFGAQYSFDLGGSGSITLGGQTRYKSNTALAVDNTIIGTTTKIDGLFQPGYWLHDARIVWEDAAKHFSVGLYGNNLADKRYKTDGQEFSSIGSIRTVYYGAPRTFTVRLTARY